jgi:oligopeptidase A
MNDNPFLTSDFSIDWAAHTPGLIASAITEALAQAQAAIDAIAGRPLAEANFANTFLALEEATEALSFAWSKVTHLQSVADSPALREAHNAMLPQVSAFYARIPLNAELWQRVKMVAESDEAVGITGIHRRLLDETVADFREAGADLPDEQRRRLEEIQSELAKLTQAYSENVLDATNAWDIVITDETRLAGIPEHAREAARQSALSKGQGSEEQPAWRFTLHMPSMEPVMVYAEDEALRREIWAASTAVGSTTAHDNQPLVPQILALRDEKAKLLGKAHFADHVLARRMAKSGAAARAFVQDLQDKSSSQFTREVGELETFKAAELGGEPGRLAPWELAYWAEKQRRALHDFDDEILRPYLPMDRVIAGLFELSRRVFGLVIAEQPVEPAAVWHEEVKYYTLHDEEGRHLGSFYADWHPRESKRGGAWMGYLKTGLVGSDGVREPHLGYICGNMTPPVKGRPALLTHRETETVFHEFGHLLHHLLGEVEVKSLNGVNVAWDFVELPSQIMENWCWERDSLDLFARHHETGEPIPEDIFRKMTAARNFRSASAMIRQLQFGKMDLLLHTETPDYLAAGADGLESRITAAIADTLVPTEPASRPILYRFGHLFSDPTGYAAGYYSYKWAEVLEADAFGRFLEEGIFSRETGRAFVDCILSRGNSTDPAELFRAFRGRDPDPEALLRRSGLLPVT